MIKRLFVILVVFISKIAFANEYNLNAAKIDNLIIAELEDFLQQEKAFYKFENKNFKIVISYPQQKNHDLNSLPIKKFELNNTNLMQHEFSGVIHLDSPVKEKIILSGKFQTLISLPVLKVKLAKNHVLREADLQEKLFNSEIITSSYIISKEDLIGMTLKKTLKADMAIKKEFITSAVIVKKNDLISLEHRLGKVILKVLVTAIDSGSVGDVIKVKNAKTKQIMHAEIIDDKTVKFKLN